MQDILKLNSISKSALPILSGYNVLDKAQNPVGVLLRSFNMAEYTVPSSLLAVARAGAGVNNIPHGEYAKLGICVFNTPGANANAVKELVIAYMLIACRNLSEGINFAATLNGDDVAKQVEKGKGAFSGSEILGKTLCVMGLGAIGRKVACAANALGMEIVGFDPYLSTEAKAEIPFVRVYDKKESAYENADFVTLHMPMTPETKGMINSASLATMKDGVIIINAARGELVATADIKAALAAKKVRKYITDFPDTDCVCETGIIAAPHLGASTEEAEDNCAIMAAEELKDYIENGNIKNSVNMPSLSLKKTAAHRLSIISIGTPTLSIAGVSASKFGITYTLIDTNDVIDAASINGAGIIKVRNVY